MIKKSLAFIVVALRVVAVTGGVESASAQSADDSVYSYPVVETVESSLPGDGDKFGTVDATNLRSFEALVPQELRSSVADGKLKLRTVRGLGFDWSGSTTEKAAVPMPPSIDGSIPFVDLRVFEGTDRGARVLWNSIARVGQIGQLSQTLDIRWIKEENRSLKASAVFDRVYPAAVGEKFTPEQIFRERILFKEPEPLAGLGWLTIRPLDEHEDGVWERSAVTHKVTRMTSTNRADLLFRAPFALEDLLGWSRNIHEVEVLSADFGVYLLPFSETKPGQSEAVAHGCFAIRSKQAVVVAPDPGAKKKTQATVFIEPEHRNLFFVPRKAWRLELSVKDPYSASGTEIVYIDAASFLPHLKFVFGRAGELQRRVFSPFGAVKVDSNGTLLPTLRRVVIESPLSRQLFTIDVSQQTLCPKEVGLGMSIGEFIPSKFVPFQLSPGGSAKEEKAKDEKKLMDAAAEKSFAPQVESPKSEAKRPAQKSEKPIDPDDRDAINEAALAAED